MRSDGTVWAWGDNEDGQVGNGSNTRTLTTPVQVVGLGGDGFLTGITQIAAGADHSLALMRDGTVWGWGDNSAGELGNGTTTGSATPVQTSNLSGVTGPVTAYQYDGSGLRAHKTTGGTTSNFAWDYSQGLPLLPTDGSTLYVYGLGGVPIEQVDSEGNLFYLYADQLGSTRVLADSTGTVVGTYTYDAYGNTTAKTGTASTAFQFAGEYLDSETGAYYLRARYYDPGTGQFLSRDPLLSLTRQPYGYSLQNPVNLQDPAGLGISDLLGGQLAHILIEERFTQQNPRFVDEQTFTGIGGTIRIDRLNYTSGEFYEIKPFSQATAGGKQIVRYLDWSRKNGGVNGKALVPGGVRGDMTIEVIRGMLYLYATTDTGVPGLILYGWILNPPVVAPGLGPWPFRSPKKVPRQIVPQPVPVVLAACSV